MTLDQLGAVAKVAATAELVGAEFGEYQGGWPDGRCCPPDALLDALSPLLAALAETAPWTELPATGSAAIAGARRTAGRCSRSGSWRGTRSPARVRT